MNKLPKNLIEDSIIKYSSGDESYHIVIQDNRVVGGFAQGSESWEAWGGAKIGDRLQVVFVRNDGFTGNDAWWSHTYRVCGDTMILETSVAKSGEILANRERKCTIDSYQKK